jgi:hypothetical protein
MTVYIYINVFEKYIKLNNKGGGNNNELDSNIVSQMKEILDGEIYLPRN